MFSKIARSQNLEGGRSTPPIPPRRPSSSLSVMSSASGLSQVRGSLMSPRLPRSSNLHTPSMSLSSQNSEDHHRDILQREVKTPQSHGILPPPPPPRKRSLVDIYADSLEDLEVHGRKRRSLDVQHDGSSDAEDLPSNQLGLYGGNFSAMSYEEGFDEVDIENEDEAGFANQERGIDSFVIPRLPRPSGQKPVNRQLSYSSQKSDIDEKGDNSLKILL